jgi:hypothetical protein
MPSKRFIQASGSEIKLVNICGNNYVHSIVENATLILETRSLGGQTFQSDPPQDRILRTYGVMHKSCSF